MLQDWKTQNTSKAVLPQMVKRGYGRLLHIASIAGKEGNAGMIAYYASQAAVIGMTKVQGKEVAGTGVTVNALAPAVLLTPMVQALPEQQVKIHDRQGSDGPLWDAGWTHGDGRIYRLSKLQLYHRLHIRPLGRARYLLNGWSRRHTLDGDALP